MSIVAFGGSRDLSSSFAPLVSRVVAAALARGFSIRVGCARGADALVVAAALSCSAASHLSVFCAAAPLARVAAAAAAGARVVSWAGGSSSIPFVVRLAIRSKRCIAGSSVAVFFLSSPGSRGSLRAAAAAAAAGIPVFVFLCGRTFTGSPDLLPGLPGSWQPAWLAGLSCLRWHPAQASLF